MKTERDSFFICFLGMEELRGINSKVATEEWQHIRRKTDK